MTAATFHDKNTTPDISEFEYVDTAFGGVNKRNDVRKLSAVRLNGLSDCYVSHNRATDYLVTWVQEHRNDKGNPTVARFDGPTWAPDLHLDFDAEDDQARALKWLNQVLGWLESVGVDLRGVRIYYSGAKGFHLEIPHSLFGGFAPSADLPKRLRRAAKRILGDIPFDTSVYDTLRLWRLENSKNAKSGLYKIRLTIAEARTLTIDEIRAMAADPRDTTIVPELTPIPDDEWLPVEELVGIWEATAVDDGTDESPEWRAPTDDARDGQSVAAIAASWPHGGDNVVEGEDGKGKVSRHADYLLAIGGFLSRRTNAEHVAAILAAGAEQAGDRAFLNGRDWRGEIKRIVDGAAERIERDEMVKGLPSLAKHFPALALVLDVLWPAPTIGFDWDEDCVVSAESVESPSDDDLSTLSTHTTQPRSGEIPWPDPLNDEALYGLAGDVVRAVAPYTEADPAAILGHFLCGAGVLLGMETYAVVGDAQHPPKLNVLVIGPTSKGRKGTAQRATERVLRLADGALAANIVEGLSSGEGLIWQVRDPIYKWERPKGGGESVEVLVDPGVEDKRLWVVESEFATTLRVMQRDGNTLTAIVRRAWDRDDLRTLTKNSPARATGAHIGITGHVSREELLRYLDRSELANGFANRFLAVAARRSHLLPEGDGIPEEELYPFADRLMRAREWARAGRILRRDDEARAIWHEVYADLSRERPGMFGMATNRSEAQVVRLSVLYSALECSPVIRAEHLLAALAVWRYCEQSARWAFGDATGDPTADTILSALRRGGELDRQTIYELLGRHVNRSRIDAALGLLLAHGLVQMRREPTGGRPREVWRAV